MINQQEKTMYLCILFFLTLAFGGTIIATDLPSDSSENSLEDLSGQEVATQTDDLLLTQCPDSDSLKMEGGSFEEVLIPPFEGLTFQTVIGKSDAYLLASNPRTMVKLHYHRNKAIAQIDVFFSSEENSVANWKELKEDLLGVPYIQSYKLARVFTVREIDGLGEDYGYEKIKILGAQTLSGYSDTPDKIIRFYPNGQRFNETHLKIFDVSFSVGSWGKLLWKLALNPILDDPKNWHTLTLDRFGNVKSDSSLVNVKGVEALLVQTFALPDQPLFSSDRLAIYKKEPVLTSKELIEKSTGRSLGVQRFENGKSIEIIDTFIAQQQEEIDIEHKN